MGAERLRRGRWIGSVRFRITLAVTLLFGLTLAGASLLFLQHVQRTLVDEVHTNDSRELEELRALYEGGTPPSSVLPVSARRPATQVQVMLDNGDIVAATPGAPTRALDPRPPPGVRPPIPLPLGGNPNGPSGPPNGPPPAAGNPPASRPGATPVVAGAPFTTIVPNPLTDPTANGAAGDWAVTAVPVSTAGGSAQLIAASPLDSVRESVDTLGRSLTVAIPLLVLLIAVASWFMTGLALRPVAAITARVEEISSTTLHERVPEPAAGDEVAHLARTMNAMLGRLESSASRQRQFVSDASHELRSPVATIRTELEVALLHPQHTDWSDVARNVLLEDARLERIVADLLVLARLDEEPGLDRDRAVEVDLDEVVQVEAARTRRLPVDVHHLGPAKVAGRADELSRLVGHLLDNAARHGATRVSVGLVALAGGPTALLTVDDDGPGVPAEQRATVFERFGRLEEGRSRDQGGAGLGLAVVRRIAERHGASVQVTDSPLGGARFVVDFPVLGD